MTGSPKSMRRTTRGFTLIELLVVMTLIGIIVTMVISVGSSVRINAAENETRGRLKMLHGAIETYYEALGEYPTKVGAYPADRSIVVSQVINIRGDSDQRDYWDDFPIISAQRNMAWLLTYFREIDESRKALGVLAEDCFVSVTWTDGLYPDVVYGDDSPQDSSSDEYRYIIDSFDTPINYQRSGGRWRVAGADFGGCERDIRRCRRPSERRSVTRTP